MNSKYLNLTLDLQIKEKETKKKLLQTLTKIGANWRTENGSDIERVMEISLRHAGQQFSTLCKEKRKLMDYKLRHTHKHSHTHTLR